jgi:DNA-binding NarL/FixJ family response regulator
MKILVVDDHVLIRAGLNYVLRQVHDGAQVFEAGTAPEALAIADAHPDLDLVLLDLALPGMSGLSALKTFRERHSAVPVVVISAFTEPSAVMNAIQSGAAGFIPKSCSAGLMLGAVRLVLSGGVYLPPDVLLSQSVSPPEMESAGFPGALRAAKPQVDPSELGLSERQTQVLALLVQGKSNKSIARDLKLAEQTVKGHVSAALRALNVTSRTQAVIAAAQLGLYLEPSLKEPRSGNS